MKKVNIYIAISAIAGLCLYGQTSAQASTLEADNLVLTLPDTLSISGTEVGSSNNPRKCSITASLDAKTGTTIPLRAGAVVNLVDSTGYSVDSGYAIADVEGLTHLDIVMVFKCGNGSGTATLKGPYKFTTVWRGMPGWPFGEDRSVKVTFGSSTPPAASSGGSVDASRAALDAANSKIDALNQAIADQQATISALTTQVTDLNSQLSVALKANTAASKDLVNCFRIAKSIAISKKGKLPKNCVDLK